jgi:hypothetical protein
MAMERPAAAACFLRGPAVRVRVPLVAPSLDVRLEGSEATLLGSLGPLDEDDEKQSVNDLALTSTAQRNRSKLVIGSRNANGWE